MKYPIEKDILLSNESDKKYSYALYETIKKYKILPDSYNGFIFLSTSASIATKEIGLAKIIDQEIQDKKMVLDQKPLFIASDFFGKQDSQGNFKPGFDIKSKPNLKNVNFSFLSADAKKLPIRDNSITLIMDQMGAIWEIISQCITLKNGIFKIKSQDKKQQAIADVINILEHYKSKLQDKGNIIIDALNNESITTVKLLNMLFGKNLNNELKKIGLVSKLIGDKGEKLLVLRKIEDI